MGNHNIRQLVVTADGSLALREELRPTLDGKPPGALVRVTHAVIGAGSTIDIVISRRTQPELNGADEKVSYQVSGIVEKVTPGLDHLQPGDPVCVVGAGVAHNADVVYAPCHMLARLPSGNDLPVGAMCNLAGTALHACRRAESTLGEWNVVVGLGIVGLFCVQFARLFGAKIIGTDISDQRLSAALALGADHVIDARSDNVVEKVLAITGPHGTDAVLAAAKSDDPALFQSMNKMVNPMTGRIVLIGVFPMTRPWGADIDVRLSGGCGPGWRDKNYTLQGNDYPYGFVRWPSGRNLQLFADLLGEKKIKGDCLITHRFPIEQANQAYTQLIDHPGETLGVLMEF